MSASRINLIVDQAHVIRDHIDSIADHIDLIQTGINPAKSGSVRGNSGSCLIGGVSDATRGRIVPALGQVDALL